MRKCKPKSNKQPMSSGTQLALGESYGEESMFWGHFSRGKFAGECPRWNCLGRECSWGNFRGGISHGRGRVIFYGEKYPENIVIRMQEYKLLHAAVVICAMLVNTHTHTHTHTHTRTDAQR